jgi:hypothetical protein
MMAAPPGLLCSPRELLCNHMGRSGLTDSCVKVAANAEAFCHYWQATGIKIYHNQSKLWVEWTALTGCDHKEYRCNKIEACAFFRGINIEPNRYASAKCDCHKRKQTQALISSINYSCVIVGLMKSQQYKTLEFF